MPIFDYECNDCGAIQEFDGKPTDLKDVIKLSCSNCNKRTNFNKLFNNVAFSTKNLDNSQGSFKKSMLEKRKKAANKHEQRVKAGQGIKRVSDLGDRSKFN